MHVYISTYYYSILSDSWVTQSTSYPGPFSVRPKRRGWGRVFDTVWSSSPWKIQATPLLFVFIGLSYDVTEDVKSQKGLVTSLYWYRGCKINLVLKVPFPSSSSRKEEEGEERGRCWDVKTHLQTITAQTPSHDLFEEIETRQLRPFV